VSEHRTKLKLRRRQLSPVDVAAGSRAVCDHLLGLLAQLQIENLAIYFSSENEINVAGIIPEMEFKGCQLFAPKAITDVTHPYSVAPYGGPFGFNLVTGKFGIQEPQATALAIEDAKSRVECWVVPGLGFTAAGGRIGHGRGFYDRLLAATPGIKIGIGYDWQVVPTLKQMPHDVGMDFLVTPGKIYRCSTHPHL